jgi:hypothetical protein
MQELIVFFEVPHSWSILDLEQRMHMGPSTAVRHPSGTAIH